MDQILAQVQAVAPLPGALLRLIAVVNRPGSTVQDMVNVIQYDSGLTSSMLRLCNSAYFGRARSVASLHEAVRMLGTMKVLQIVTVVQGGGTLMRAQHGYGMPPGELWNHSVAVALASAGFGRLARHPNDGLLFTAGLLHDIGKTVLNTHVADEYATIVEKVENGKLSFCEAEQQVLGCSHDEIGAALAERWELPAPIVLCIRHHHDPAGLSPPDWAVDMVYLGELACTMLGLGQGCDGLCYRAHEEALSRYGLHEADFERVGIETTIELARVRRLFSEVIQPGERDARSPASAEA